DVRRAEQRGDDGVRDLILDDVGAAVPARVNDHLRVGKVRNRVEGDVADRPDSAGECDSREQQYEKAVLRAEFDETLDHDRQSYRASSAGFANAASAARKRDSESIRKFAEVTTSSPTCNPLRTS